MKRIKKKYDVIIMQTGSAGSACALRCAKLGLNTLCVNGVASSTQPHNNFSTIFENLSIIALLESAKLYENVVKHINNHGIYADNVRVNLQQMMARKNHILDEINTLLIQNFNKHNVDYLNVNAQLINSNTIQISSNKNSAKQYIQAKHIVLATDSIPISLPFAPIDNEFILDSTSALNITEIPEVIAILGAGILGLEISGILHRLGSKIIILEAQDIFLNVTDHQISSLAYRLFSEQNLEIRLGARVLSTKIFNKKVYVEYQDSDGIKTIKVDKLIVASGRKPNSDNIAVSEANLLLDESGFVYSDEEYKTNLPNVYAIGDLTIHGPMLSHKGIAEGNYVAEKIAGLKPNPINYNSMPSIIYTEPEIAWVGQSEQALKAMGIPINTATYSFDKNYKAKTHCNVFGFLKMITHQISDEILGVHMIGSHATEIISEASLAIEFSANNEDLVRAIHSHPSFNEALYEVG